MGLNETSEYVFKTSFSLNVNRIWCMFLFCTSKYICNYNIFYILWHRHHAIPLKIFFRNFYFTWEWKNNETLFCSFAVDYFGRTSVDKHQNRIVDRKQNSNEWIFFSTICVLLSFSFPFFYSITIKNLWLQPVLIIRLEI